MSLPIVMRPEAQSDLLAARRWYERQREGWETYSPTPSRR